MTEEEIKRKKEKKEARRDTYFYIFMMILVVIGTWEYASISFGNNKFDYHVRSNNKTYICQDYSNNINAVEFYNCKDKNNKFISILYLTKNNLIINKFLKK